MITEEFDLQKFMDAVNEHRNPIIVRVGSKYPETHIKRATAPQVFQVLQIVKSVAKTMEVKTLADLEQIAIRIEEPAFFLEVISAAWPQVIELLVALTNRTKPEIESIDLDDLILLAWQVWKLNERFFTDRVLPTLGKLDLFGSGNSSQASSNPA